MSSGASPAHPPVAAWRWGVVWLLFLATMLNYLDRLALNNTQRYLLPEFAPARVEPQPLAAAGGAAAPPAAGARLSRLPNRAYARIQVAFGGAFPGLPGAAAVLVRRFR